MEQKKKTQTQAERDRARRKYYISILLVVCTITYYFMVTLGAVANENVAYLVLGYIAHGLQSVISHYFGAGEKKEESEEKETEIKNT